MIRPRGVALAALCAALATAAPAAALVRVARPGEAPAAIAAAAAGDTVWLAPGVHPGPLVVRAAITLRGARGAVVDGGGRGSAISIAADGARVEDLAVRGTGSDKLEIDAAVRVIGAGGVRLSRLVVRDALYGVYAERAQGLVVEDAELEGRATPSGDAAETGMEGDGNGVHLWYTPDAVLARNRITRFTDGVYLSFAHRVRLERNLLWANARYGLHTMYCDHDRLIANRFTRNVAGCALMFTNHLEARGNAFVRNQGSRTYGLLLRDCSDGVFTDNRIVTNTIGMFLDGSNRNRFVRNLVQDNGWGAIVFASCADNLFTRNAFVQNDYAIALDMRLTNDRFDDGRDGNWWSGQSVWDLDGDGRGDASVSPVSAFAFLSKQYPDLTLLAASPAVAALSAAERVFPALRPSEAVDRHPLIAPPRLAASEAPPDPGGAPPRSRAARRALAAAAFAAMSASGMLGLALRGGRG